MLTTLTATALPYSLADDAPFQLTVFLTHKLVADANGPAEPVLQDFPAAADWITTLAGSRLSLTTSLDPATAIPLRIVSEPAPDAASWAAVLPPTTPVAAFPAPVLSAATWRSNPAHRMSDHVIDLHLAAITASPGLRSGVAADPVAQGLLGTLANLDQDGSLRRLLSGAEDRKRRDFEVVRQRLADALTTIGPLRPPLEFPGRKQGWELPPLPDYNKEVIDRLSPIQVLLDDPEADTRVTKALDGLVGQDLSANPTLQLIVDAHAMRRYYERPELPQQTPQQKPSPDAPPTPRPVRPEQDVHARIASFGATPVLLRRLGLALDVVLDGLDAAGARAALAGATWVSISITPPEDVDLQVLPARRTAVIVDGPVFAARSSDAWVSGALPLGEDDWVVLDADPDASGLKLDQYTRNLVRQYASEANGDPATSAPATVRATGFALARRDRSNHLRKRVQRAEQIAADNGELQYDDLVRGIRLEVWDDVTHQWHSLHRRLVTVTGEPAADGDARVGVLDAAVDVGFLQLSGLNRAPADPTNGYYLHEVVAGWDGWSLSAPRPGRTIVHVEPPGADGSTEAVVETLPDAPIPGAQISSRVAPGSLPRLRYGTSYSLRVLGVDLAGNSVPQVRVERRVDGLTPGEFEAARSHLERLRRSYERRDTRGLAAVVQAALVDPIDERPGPMRIPEELRSGDRMLDATLERLVVQATAGQADPGPAAVPDLARASRILAAGRRGARVRPQLKVDLEQYAVLARNDDLLLPERARRATRPIVTTPRPYLRWEPVPAPTIVAINPLGTGEQLAHLVVRSGSAVPAQRHIAPPKATQLEAETAGLFDTAIGTGGIAEIQRQYAIALAERGTLLDQFVADLNDPSATIEQPGIALVDRPAADITSENRATLADISAQRGRPIGEGQYVVHDVDALRLPYLPDPYAVGLSLVFTEAGSPHVLPEPRALQAVSVPYPGRWPSLQPLRLVLEPGDVLNAHVEGHVVHVTLPPGEQVRVALSSTLDAATLERFGLWRSHLASVVDPSDGFTTDEVVASAALQRAAAAGWTWWLTPSTDARLVHAVPAPIRPPQLRGLEVLLRPWGRSIAALSGLVDVHGSSTDTLVVRGRWQEWVDDPSAPAPVLAKKSDVVVRSSVGALERTGVLYLYDFQPTGALAAAFGNGGIAFHRAIQTFEDTHHRRVTYVPSGTTRYAEYFDPSEIPDGEDPVLEGEPVVLDVLSSARPAAPTVLDAVPLLRWESQAEPADPFGWRRIRRSGVRLWLARPWFSSGDGELLGVLVFDTDEWVRDPEPNGPWKHRQKPVQAPDGATSLWAADPIATHGGPSSLPTLPPLLGLEHLLVDLAEATAEQAFQVVPPIDGRPLGSSNRAWPQRHGSPVAVAARVPLLDVNTHPEARVLGYVPVFDEQSKRWYVDIAMEETPALWPFVRLAVARWQPHSIEGAELSAITLAGWVQPLPTRTLTVTRPDSSHVQVTLSGVVNWLRWNPHLSPELPAEVLSADSPTGDAAARAGRLRASRTVRASVQSLAPGAGDLEWQAHTTAELIAVVVEESGGYRATWTGSVNLLAPVELRRPGEPSAAGTQWRVLVEEHELLDSDLDANGIMRPTPRLVYADTVAL